VLEFFSNKSIEPTEDLLEAMAAIGTQLGRVVERERFERELSASLLAEQRRVGEDLHDVIGQELAGLALSADRMHGKLQDKRLPEAEGVRRLADGLRSALASVRRAVRGLLSVAVKAESLPAALREYAASAQERFGVSCALDCGSPIPVRGADTAVHLFRIATEAANNAARHAQAGQIHIRLAREGPQVVLEVRDDGTGISDEARREPGLGLRIMRHRAKVIGAALDVRRGERGGTVVTCTLPVEADDAEAAGQG
jgi:signal transduction histidine kinase